MKNNYIFRNINFLLIIMLLGAAQTAQAHWTTRGPYGGSVSTMLRMDTTIFVGTFNGGVYRNLNSQALSWRYANYTGLTSAQITALAAIGNTVFAGTADAGIFATTDLGVSWTSVNTGLNNLQVQSLTTSGVTLIAGTNGGIFLSNNNGGSWTASNTGLTNLDITALTAGGGAIFAGTEASGVFVSINGGANWTAVNTGLDDLHIKALAVAGTTLLAATETGVFSANALTLSWTNVGLTNVVVNGLSVDGSTVYAATSAGVFTSPAGSIAWTPANSGYTGSVNAVVAYNNKLYAGTQDDGILRSQSTTTIAWAKFNNGFNNLQAFTVYNDGLLVIVATNKGLFVSKDLAANYVASNTGLDDSLHITDLTFAGTALYVGTAFGGVYMSPDTGKTWTAVNAGLPTLNVRKIIATDTRIIVALAGGLVYSTSTTTIAWTAATGLPAIAQITCLATDGSTAWLGAPGPGVFRSTDGLSWNAFNDGWSNQNVTSLVVHGGYLFAGTYGGGVFRTSINGGNWIPMNAGLPTQNILSLASAGQHVVAGYRGGVHVTFDDGDSWAPTEVLDFIPDYADIHTISFTEASTRIFVATPENSVYSNGVGELPVSVSDLLPADARLLLSPNPNRGQFQITLEKVDAVIRSVVVYDALGRIVQRGEYDNRNQPLTLSVQAAPGVYTVQVGTTKGSIARQIIIQ